MASSTTGSLELLRAHMALECIGLDDAGSLVRIPGPCPDEIPRFYAADLAGTGHVVCVRDDVPPDLRAALLALPPAAALEDVDGVRELFARHGMPVAKCWRGKSYVFPESLGPHDFPDVVSLDARDWAHLERFDARIDPCCIPVQAVLVAGAIVATCVSSREDARSAEAWVQTALAHQRRGYGRQVVAAWGCAVRSRGKRPFYSHVLENTVSQSLADSLGLIRYLTDTAYD